MNRSLKIVFITMPNSKEAVKLAKLIVKNHLAACVNIVNNIQSIYCWDNKIQHDDEVLLMVKSSSNKIDLLDKFIEKHHPYSIAEYIVISPEEVSEKYEQWVLQYLH